MGGQCQYGVNTVCYQVGEIYDALVKVADTTNDPKSQATATLLVSTVISFTFLVV